jgi:hypothetical protein
LPEDLAEMSVPTMRDLMTILDKPLGDGRSVVFEPDSEISAPELAEIMRIFWRMQIEGRRNVWAEELGELSPGARKYLRDRREDDA